MRQIIYSDKALKKLTTLDPDLHRNICEVLESHCWKKIPSQTVWLRFVHNFKSWGGNKHKRGQKLNSRTKRKWRCLCGKLFSTSRH